MKTTIVLIAALFCSAIFANAQEKEKNTQEKEKKWKIGFALSGFYDPTGNYSYILNSNSTTTEIRASQKGAMLSSVLEFKMSHLLGLAVSLPIADYTSISSKVNVFNKVSAAGIGPTIRLNDNVHFTLMINYGQTNRMNDQARTNQQFPLNVYPTLHVNGAIPDDILAPYNDKNSKLIYSTGLIFFLD